MFVDVDMIVAGAVEETRTFTDQVLFDEWLDAVEKSAEASGYRTEVQALFHDHALKQDVSCDCSQYVTDHKPYRVFNPDGAT